MYMFWGGRIQNEQQVLWSWWHDKTFLGLDEHWTLQLPTLDLFVTYDPRSEKGKDIPGWALHSLIPTMSHLEPTNNAGLPSELTSCVLRGPWILESIGLHTCWKPFGMFILVYIIGRMFLWQKQWLHCTMFTFCPSHAAYSTQTRNAWTPIFGQPWW